LLFIGLGALALAVAGATIVQAETLPLTVVSATSDVFDAGESTPSTGGTVPTAIALPSNSQFLEFPSVTGTVQASGGWPVNGPDGFLQSTNIYAYPQTGISGIRADTAMFLAGVFLTDLAMTPGDEPQRLNFTASTGIGSDFTSLSPALGQIFFIGDGQTSGSVLQQFNVPAGATRLFLGFADAVDFGGANGAFQGNYGGNSGSFDVGYGITARPTPEPGTLALLAAGVVGLIGYGTRRRWSK
jgi:hypothetical protein